MDWLRRQDDEERSPVLDVGCGDGFWWTVRERQGDVYGVDISEREVSLARSHIKAELLDVARSVPFPDRKFREIIGNCSLEHIRDIDAAVRNLRAPPPTTAGSSSSSPRATGPSRATQERAPQARTAPRHGALRRHERLFQHWHLYDLKGCSLLEGAGEVVARTAWATLGGAAFASSSLVARELPGESGRGRILTVPRGARRHALSLRAAALVGPGVSVVPADSPSVYEYMIVRVPLTLC